MPGLSVAPATQLAFHFLPTLPAILVSIVVFALLQVPLPTRQEQQEEIRQEIEESKKKLATIEQVSPSPRFNKKPGRLYRPGFLLRSSVKPKSEVAPQRKPVSARAITSRWISLVPS
ncbi:hypothetical protein [Rhodanobacter lindaniclasticus]